MEEKLGKLGTLEYWLMNFTGLASLAWGLELMLPWLFKGTFLGPPPLVVAVAWALMLIDGAVRGIKEEIIDIKDLAKRPEAPLPREPLWICPKCFDSVRGVRCGRCGYETNDAHGTQ